MQQEQHQSNSFSTDPLVTFTSHGETNQRLESLEDGTTGHIGEDGIQTENRPKHSDKSQYIQIASFWDVLAFGICLVSANLTYGVWHAGLVLGFWSFFFATLIMCTVFVSVHLCIAEMISILPFSGGMYGFARVTLGPYFGFIVGCLESMGNVIYAMIGMLELGSFFTYIIGQDDRKYEPLYWLAFYLIILANEFFGRKYYFKMLKITACLILLIFLMYMACSIPETHPKKYIPDDAIKQTFFYGADITIISLQISAFVFFGLEIIPLVSDEVANARKDTPRALVGTMVFLIVSAFLIMFFSYCQAPGYPLDLYFSKSSLNSGFKNSFHINDRMATVFAYFPLLAAVSIYVFGFAKQMKALGQSRLLPSCFGWTMKDSNVPYVSLIVGCSVGYGLLLLAYFLGEVYTGDSLPFALYITAYIGTYTTFILVLISFIIFRVKYYNLKREFVNPLGITGAVYGICGMLILLYILFRYSSKEYTDVIIYCCFIGIVSIFYLVYSRTRQTFSEEEQKIMFVVYLMQCKCLLFPLLSFSEFPLLISFPFLSERTKASPNRQCQTPSA
jgi:ethanolamine permease